MGWFGTPFATGVAGRGAAVADAIVALPVEIDGGAVVVVAWVDEQVLSKRRLGAAGKSATPYRF